MGIAAIAAVAATVCCCCLLLLHCHLLSYPAQHFRMEAKGIWPGLGLKRPGVGLITMTSIAVVASANACRLLLIIEPASARRMWRYLQWSMRFSVASPFCDQQLLTTAVRRSFRI